MATFILEPGETTTHTHETISTSTLLDGEVEMKIDNTCVQMKKNEPVEVPQGAQHTMLNTGQTEARVACIC
jgi:mannose-6-phosphate isomerase-like protein (cupin superfamily)